MASLPVHHLRIAELDSLAGGNFDRNAISTLLSVERSRRLMLLWLVRRYAEDRPAAHGPLPPVADAWQLLLRVESANRQVVEEMLADPQTGLWVGHTLRRLREVIDDPAPLWYHVGQLHSVAIAVAIRAGIEASIAIPVWNGIAVLPSLGYARLPVDDEWSHAEVAVHGDVEIRCAGTVVTIDPRSDRPADNWSPATLFRLGAMDKELSIRLDDLGPYRGLDKPAGPTRLPAAEVDRWRELFTEAWSLLVRDHEDRANELAMGLTCVTPLPAAFRFRPRSISVDDAFGAAILSEPYDAAQLAVTLVHEFQHSVLNGIRHVAALVDGDDPATGYAPWRDDPRPLGGLIHGVFAFTAIAEFWAVHRTRTSGADADFANFELALWRRQAALVLQTIRNHPALTVTGARFLEGIGLRLAPLAKQPVPSQITAIAKMAAVDHESAWRACHLQPDPDRVAALAAAWATGRPAPPASGHASPAVRPDRSGQRLDAKAALMRVKLTDPEQFSRLRAEPGLVPGASAADVALVEGDLESARTLFLKELSQTPQRGPAWSGLGLTLAALGETDSAEIILQQPHTIRALLAMRSDTEWPGPDELATWLSRKQE